MLIVPPRLALSGDISDFEAQTKSFGIPLNAVQLDRGESALEYDFIRTGSALLSALRTNRDLAIDWQTREDSVNFAFQIGGYGGVKFDGRERLSDSVILYSGHGSQGWAGRVNAMESQARTALHVSIPLAGARVLCIPNALVQSGWLELELEREAAVAFASWAEGRSLASHSAPENVHLLEDQVYWWLQKLLAPILFEELEMNTISHYMRIVRSANQMSDLQPDDPPSVVELASRLRLSIRTLQRAYTSTFGISVSAYLRNRRLKRAHELLRVGDITVQRAAYANGFYHLPRFSQQYRRLFGSYPSETASRGR